MSIHSELLKKVNEHLLEYGTNLPTELHDQIVHDMLVIDEAIKILDAKVVKDLPEHDWSCECHACMEQKAKAS